MSEPVLQLDGLVRTFRQGSAQLQVLAGVDLTLQRGEIVALVGPSGAGKSTLLHQSGLLERPDAGQVRVFGRATAKLNDVERTKLRREEIGFVYQSHHLLVDFSALENVVLPQMLAGRSKREAAKRADELLEQVGLSGRRTHRPGKLSGGEQQRVAIARALANRPALLLADEPTGNLDTATAEIVFALLLDVVRRTGTAALIATHNPELALRMDRVVRLERGLLRPVTRVPDMPLAHGIPAGG
ncbi:ABC transporter ATP-binding protein [Geminicoccus roseus]|uniref:ABC transporter ATP-binding protein n=1 Tax=Geminicoccus roseus TaxID=404900 RepID=UPI00040D5AC8|nr:ABC transporter ATP-binding protein [Geminicoccus roseus]